MGRPQADYDPGPQIAHAGSINLGTPDLERSLWFFRDLLGMEVVAETDGSGHRVELYSGRYPIHDPDWEALESKLQWGQTGLVP